MSLKISEYTTEQTTIEDTDRQELSTEIAPSTWETRWYSITSLFAKIKAMIFDDFIEHTLTNDANKVPASDAVFAAIGAVPVPNLNEVLVEGNETLGTNIKVNDADAIELENASLLKKGTYDFGGLGGISRICGVGYEDMWQSGIHHVFDNMGFLRESTNCFNIIPDAGFDSTLRFQVGSRWVLDDGTTYVCLNATPGSVDWDLIPSVPTLQDVTDAGNTTTNAIWATDLKSFSGSQVTTLTADGKIDYTPDNTIPANKTYLEITPPTATRAITFKDESGTVAFLSDITGGATPTLQEVLDTGNTTTTNIVMNNSTLGVIDVASAHYALYKFDKITTNNGDLTFPIAGGILARIDDLNDKQDKSVEVTGSITAVLNKYYIATATATFTDPTPAQGKGFIVLVRNGTATIGGVAYSTAGTLVYRYYNSGAWATYTFGASSGGDVVGPASATTDNIAVFNGTTGKIIKDGGATIAGINTNAVDLVTVKLAEAINKGQAVYVSGANGTNILVSKASNTSEATSSKTLGLLATSGATNAIVNVVTSGLLDGINTSAATIGDPVWLGTSGNLIYGLASKPYAPAHLVYIGVVSRVSATVGEIIVKVQNGFELKEIHDVDLITNAPTNNQALVYESSSSLWKNKSLTTADIASSTDKNYVTDAQAVVIGNTSGTNSGNETTTTIGTLINGATSKTTPVDADQVALMDSAASNIIKKLSWANIKATLKTYFDTIYQAVGTYLTASNNLSDLTNTTTARTNLKILQAENAAIITNNTITATAITGLSFSAAANKIYYIYGAMRFGSGGVGGTRFSVTIPTGATIGFELIGTASSQVNTSNANIDAGASLSIAFCTVTSSAGVLHFKGTIETSSTAGTVQLNFAAGIAGQTSQINKLGTYLIAIEK
jgi:hypothetical protein